MNWLIRKKFLPEKAVFLLLGATLLLLGLSWLLPPGAVWITDNGNKYLQMRNYQLTGELAMHHPDPEFFPMGGFHFIRHNGQIRSFYPEFLSLITLPFYRIFGERGVIFLPAVATIILILSALAKWKSTSLSWCILSGTPLIFYALLMWEMNISTLFTCWGLWFIFSGNPAYTVAGFLIGLGVWMREEGYFVLASLGLMLLFQRRFKDVFAIGKGAAMAIFPLWAYQYWQYNHILGLHGARYHLNNAHIETAWEQIYGIFFNYWHHLFRFESLGKWSNLAILPLVAAVVSGVWQKWNRGKTIIAWLSMAVLVLLSGGLWWQKSPEYTAGVTASLITATPVTLGFFLNWRKLINSSSSVTSNLAKFVIIYLIAVPPLLTRADIGLIWGARHWLCIMPFLVYLSMKSWRQIKFEDSSLKNGFIIFALLSISIQVYGIYALYKNSSRGAELERIVAAMPEETVVSDLFFLPEQTPRLFFAKRWYEAKNVPKLIYTMKKRGIKEFVLILSPRFRRLKNEELAELLNLAPLVAQPHPFYPNSATIWELFIAKCRIKN